MFVTAEGYVFIPSLNLNLKKIVVGFFELFEQMSDLTSNLHLELQKTSQSFSRWADYQCDKLESADQNFERQMEECKSTIVALKENEVHLENCRETMIETKQRQLEEISFYKDETERLRQQLLQLEPQLHKLSEEENLAQIHRSNVENESQNIIKMKQRKYNDLTKGISLYKYLGLEFQKADGDCMRFIFTQIDESNPQRQYYFTIFVDDQDSYQFVNSNPPLDKSICSQYIQKLNVDSNIARFVANMRRAFKETL